MTQALSPLLAKADAARTSQSTVPIGMPTAGSAVRLRSLHVAKSALANARGALNAAFPAQTSLDRRTLWHFAKALLKPRT